MSETIFLLVLYFPLAFAKVTDGYSQDYWDDLYRSDEHLYMEIQHLMDTFGYFQNDRQSTDSLNYGRMDNFFLSCVSIGGDHWTSCKSNL